MVSLVRTWILLSTLLVASGWILSAFHGLGWFGYWIIFFLAAATLFLWQRKSKWRLPKSPASVRQKFARRFKHPAPLIFLALASLALLGGLLYPPSNEDSSSYRIPRVMHWLAAGQWHWISTQDYRMNIAGCGMEWMFAPLILLTRTDRFLFLPNLISFLLLPGLIFSVFRRLGVASRVAWWWMWLLPSGWCFIMQAGSTVNDSFAAVYALAAIDLGLRGGEKQNANDLWLAMLSAALATGVKQTAIPLAIPGLIILWLNRRLLFRRLFLALVTCGLALLVSALPITVLNLKYTGIWSGVAKGAPAAAILDSPFWGVIGNSFSLIVQNLKPPFFPFSNAWNQLMEDFLNKPFGAHFREFEQFGRLTFGAGEASAPLGAAICLLTAASLLAAWRCRRTAGTMPAGEITGLTARVLRWVPWGLLLLFMAKVGAAANGRQLASYYILLFPSLLALSGQAVVVRMRWWKTASISVMVLAAAMLVTSRDRPLFPSQTLVRLVEQKLPQSKMASNVLDTYAETPAFTKERTILKGILPRGEKVLGYAPGWVGQLESSLWLPFGERRIVDVLPGATLEQLHNLRYVVLEDDRLKNTNETLPQWLSQYNAVLVTQWDFLENPRSPPQRFYLVLLKSSKT